MILKRIRWFNLAFVVFVFFIGYLMYPVINLADQQQPGQINNRYVDEKISPFDHIKENSILVYDDKVILDIENAEWASFTNTNSMDPVIDNGMNAIEIKPKSNKQIHTGDIISFKTGNGIIIHRVVEIGNDESGWFAYTKGDNNPFRDPDKVRFEDIERLVVAIIY